MNFLRLRQFALVPCLLSMVFAPIAAQQPDARKPATHTDQSTQEIILIGEMHGTQETPRLFRNLVAVAAGEKNKRIGVGLELPTALQAHLDEAVKKNTRIESFGEQLLADPAWQKFANFKDGRSSQAMMDLISNMVQLAQSQRVSFFFFDTQVTDRDETMAKFIGQRVREHGYDETFILAGNIHANRASRYPGMKKRTIVPMGYKLQEQGFAVHSYDVRYSEGETWACMPECGIHHLQAYPVEIDQQGYDAVLFVGPVHASEPVHESAPAKGVQ